MANSDNGFLLAFLLAESSNKNARSSANLVDQVSLVEFKTLLQNSPMACRKFKAVDLPQVLASVLVEQINPTESRSLS